MIRKLLHYWLVALLLGPGGALALEIGEIQVSSALNQLFDAKIPLPALTPEELGKVSVKLAGPPMFKEFGLDRSPMLGNLVFAIEYNAEGQVYVRVVSTQPIREPSLALLLEFGWPRGKTFREFTVFLDPVQRLVKRSGGRTKTVMASSASVVYGPEAETLPPPPVPEAVSPVPEVPLSVLAVAPETARPPVEWTTSPAAAVAPLPPPEPVKTYSPGDHYPVVSGEGLWAIALKTRPDPGITREQMMQALFRANPQAFSKAGIPGLKIGATLRIPTLREIADLTGSPVAQRLAEKKAVAALTNTAKPGTKPALAATTPPVADLPQAFPLLTGAVPEPVALPAAEPAPEPVPEPAPVMMTAPESATTAEPIRATVQPEAAESSAQILEPVSATPLLLLAITEMMAAHIQIPAVGLLPTRVPVVAVPAPVRETVADAGPPPAVEPSAPVAETPPVVETPPVAEPSAPVITEPVAPAIDQRAGQYGPVAANERLWDIATQVRPDPAIPIDVMMRALFMANPQAFSKAGNMNSLKVGATLRVPSVQEILDLTGSKAAKRLLEPAPAPVPTAEPDR